MISRLLSYFKAQREKREKDALVELKARYHTFRIFLENNGRALELIVGIDNQLNRGEETEIRNMTEELLSVTSELVDGLNLLANDAHVPLYAVHGTMAESIKHQLDALSGSQGEAEVLCIPLALLEKQAYHLAGLKACKLAMLRQMALPVPDGFVCTTIACKKFLRDTGIAPRIREQLRTIVYEHGDVVSIAAMIRDMIMEATLPEILEDSFKAAYVSLAAGSEGLPAISVRSSGVSEDGGEHSFAGQYTSILNVRGQDEFISAFKEVVASGFTARAIMYRQNAGMSPLDFDLAVLCQVMVNPSCAGILFTHDPSAPDSGRMLISAVPGLGTTAVGGTVPVDLYRPWRRVDRRDEDGAARECGAKQELTDDLFDGAEIAHKTSSEIAAPDGGLSLVAVSPEEADLPLLSRESLAELMRLGEIIESLEGGPQDVEWAVSMAGEVIILQARPLRLAPGSSGKRTRISPLSTPRVSGTCAASGRVVGKIQLIRSAGELDSFVELSLQKKTDTEPCILTLPQSIVDAAGIMQRCAGVIIATGNPTDHLSCIAREFGIPMITGAKNALSCLENDNWVILDADNGVVVDAPESVWSAVVKDMEKKGGWRGTKTAPAGGSRDEGQLVVQPERKALRKLIVPLNLTDAYGPTFSRMECRSLHDLIRYTHEMAVLAMFEAGDQVMEDAGGLLRPLEIGVPFSFLVIDVGGGVRRDKRSSFKEQFTLYHPLNRDDILSMPLIALCEGLTTPGLNWSSEPDAAALSGIMSRTMLDARSARPAGSFNYALAARDYLNLNARVEFHFAMLDSVCGRDSHANYIRFRFKGGGAGVERSRRRAEFLRRVLESNDFYTSVVGDLVTASLTGATKDVVQDRLVMLGKLLGFSRFLDGVMVGEDTPGILADAFLHGQLDARAFLETEEHSVELQQSQDSTQV